MTFERLRRATGVIAAVAIAWMVSAAVPAGAVTCGVNGIVGNAGCQIGTTLDDNPFGATQVNPDNMFGVNTWKFAESRNGQPVTVKDLGFTLTGTKGAGTWSFNASALRFWNNVMITLRVRGDGSQENYVGYLLNTTAGTFKTPFTLNGAKEGIWRFAVYVESVPVPAAFPLLAVALGGFGLLGWRRRKSAV
jgi:hypothetical protein